MPKINWSGTSEERFWKYVKKGGENDCWEWVGAKNKNNYGIIKIGGRKGKNMIASRFSYELHKGKIPDGLHVLHSCDNPPCVNPKHLCRGTQKKNMKDMMEKERGNKAKGEKCSLAKLSQNEVFQIRNMYKNGTKWKNLSLIYGVSIRNIAYIVSKKTWK
jgi:hypothetical protein